MSSKWVCERKAILGFLGCAAVSAALLFANLGSFGMWEPHETALADGAETFAAGEGRRDAYRYARLEGTLARVGWRAFGRNEWGMRLPIAATALSSLVLLFAVLYSVGTLRLAVLAALFYSAAPLFLFHGKQLTGGAPLLLAEIAAFGGLSVALLRQRRSVRVVGVLVALLGLALGSAGRGILVGVFAPLMAVAAAAHITAGAPVAGSGERGPRARPLIALLMAGAALLAAGIYAAVVLMSDADVPFLSGGIDPAVNRQRTFVFPLEQIVYGWFPWVALLPLSVAPFFRETRESANKSYLRALVMTGLLFEYLAQLFSLEVGGLAPATVAFPMALGVALALDDVIDAPSPRRLPIFIAAALFALMIRDFAQNNQALLYGYGFDDIPIPEKYYTHVIRAGLFGIPFALLLLVAFLAKSRFRQRLLAGLIPLAPLAFGSYLAFGLIPGLSVHLSSRHAADVYEKYRTGDEPLAVYGTSRFFADAEQLKSAADVVDWLTRDERVFALFPPDKLVDFDRKMRAKTGDHIFVLDAKSERFMVATSKPLADEKDENPIAPFVRSEPFRPGPENAMSVNFDDKVTLLGWDLERDGQTEVVHKGKEMVFTSYWRVDGGFAEDYKIFMHIDGPGGRIHGDHEPFGGKLPTSKWRKGDYLKEVYRLAVPRYQASGKYRIKMGLYKGNGRLSVKNEPTAHENAIFVTSIMLE